MIGFLNAARILSASQGGTYLVLTVFPFPLIKVLRSSGIVGELSLPSERVLLVLLYLSVHVELLSL